MVIYPLLFASLPFAWGVHAAEPNSTPTPAERIAARIFPSIFQAWNRADNLKDEDHWATVARHDLVFHAPDFFGLKWEGKHNGLATAFNKESLATGAQLRKDLLKRNPNLILIAELRYRDAHRSFLPADHVWWKRKNDKIVPGWEEGGYFQLDFVSPGFRSHLARQAKAIMESGVFDGVMLDWWEDDDDRLALVKEIRKQVGLDALILANANDRKTPKTASYINGYFMECYKSKTAEDWKQIADTLEWAEKNLREPRINCLETWFHKSRNDLALMRATTALALTMSNGYCLFSDPNPLPTPDHLHDWYPFWNKSLGRAKSKGRHHADGSIRREFERGLVVYNPFGNQAITIELKTAHTSAASETSGKSFRIEAGDGDLFLIDAKK